MDLALRGDLGRNGDQPVRPGPVVGNREVAGRYLCTRGRRSRPGMADDEIANFELVGEARVNQCKKQHEGESDDARALLDATAARKEDSEGIDAPCGTIESVHWKSPEEGEAIAASRDR